MIGGQTLGPVFAAVSRLIYWPQLRGNGPSNVKTDGAGDWSKWTWTVNKLESPRVFGWSSAGTMISTWKLIMCYYGTFFKGLFLGTSEILCTVNLDGRKRAAHICTSTAVIWSRRRQAPAIGIICYDYPGIGP